MMAVFIEVQNPQLLKECSKAAHHCVSKYSERFPNGSAEWRRKAPVLLVFRCSGRKPRGRAQHDDFRCFRSHPAFLRFGCLSLSGFAFAFRIVPRAQYLRATACVTGAYSAGNVVGGLLGFALTRCAWLGSVPAANATAARGGGGGDGGGGGSGGGGNDDGIGGDAGTASDASLTGLFYLSWLFVTLGLLAA